MTQKRSAKRQTFLIILTYIYESPLLLPDIPGAFAAAVPELPCAIFLALIAILLVVVGGFASFVHMAIVASSVVVPGFIYIMGSHFLPIYHQPPFLSIHPTVGAGHFAVAAQLGLLHAQAHSLVFRNAAIPDSILYALPLTFLIMFVAIMAALCVGKLAYE